MPYHISCPICSEVSAFIRNQSFKKQNYINMIFKFTVSSIHQAEISQPLPKLLTLQLKHQHCFATSKNCRVTERSMNISFLTHSCNIPSTLRSVESQGEALTTQHAPSFPRNSVLAKLVTVTEALNSSGFPRINQLSQGTEEI